MAQPPTSGKQLISSHSADQNQEMLYDIHFPPGNISVAGPSALPSGNNTSGHTHTLDTQQKNKKSTQEASLKRSARKCWKCEKGGCVGRIRKGQCKMPVVHVVQRNVKERIADTPLILVNFF